VYRASSAGLSPFLGDSNAETFENIVAVAYTLQEEEFLAIRFTFSKPNNFLTTATRDFPLYPKSVFVYFKGQ
jgi:hypothetical protein